MAHADISHRKDLCDQGSQTHEPTSPTSHSAGLCDRLGQQTWCLDFAWSMKEAGRYREHARQLLVGTTDMICCLQLPEGLACLGPTLQLLLLDAMTEEQPKSCHQRYRHHQPEQAGQSTSQGPNQSSLTRYTEDGEQPASTLNSLHIRVVLSCRPTKKKAGLILLNTL